MRLLLKKDQAGRLSVNWLALAVCVVLVPLVVVGGIELFWYQFTGGLSPLMALFGLVGSLLIVIRLFGEALSHQNAVGRC